MEGNDRGEFWLLEEPGASNEIKQHKRGPKTRLAPPELSQFCAILGSSQTQSEEGLGPNFGSQSPLLGLGRS
jgi:hypothetical protein